jgi:hypothetical protein
MKYGDLTLGQVEAIVNKLGGMGGASRFLRGESVVKMVERVFPIWKTITLGTHKNAEALRNALKQAGYRVSSRAEDVMSKPAFSLAPQEITIQLATATVVELGFTVATRYDAICARIKELGYSLCPAEVGPQLRLQYPDQPMGEWLTVAMEPITASDGGPLVFYVALVEDVRWLDAIWGDPGVLWLPGFRFVFCK